MGLYPGCEAASSCRNWHKAGPLRFGAVGQAPPPPPRPPISSRDSLVCVPPCPFHVPGLGQPPSPFSPEALLPPGNCGRPLLAGALCPQPALQGIAGLRVSVGPRWVLDKRGLEVTQATALVAARGDGRPGGMPGTCVCVGSGRRGDCHGASAVFEGRAADESTGSCLLFTSRPLPWWIPTAPSQSPSCCIVFHPCLSGDKGPPDFLVLFLRSRKESWRSEPKGPLEAMHFASWGLALEFFGGSWLLQKPKVKVLSSPKCSRRYPELSVSAAEEERARGERVGAGNRVDSFACNALGLRQSVLNSAVPR